MINKKFKTILIDDELPALEYLERRLLDTGKFKVIGTYTNPLLGEERILNENVDVIFLDIHIPKINGLELAGKILEVKPEIIIIFITAYNEHAVQAFELHALDYLLKPVEKNRLEKTITRIEKHLTPILQPTLSKDSIVRVNLFKQLSIELDWGIKETLQWRTAKAQQIFLYLLHHREQLISKSLLVDQFWIDCEPENGYSQLYTTIYHIRKSLSKYNNYLTLSSLSEGYILRVNNVIIDTEEWEKTILSLPDLNSHSIGEYTRAMSLYSGGYLQDNDFWWAETERHRLERLWLKLAYNIAGWHHLSGNLEASIEVYHNICNVNPYEEDAYFSLMKIYRSMDKVHKVEEQYNRLKESLMKGLNVKPRDVVLQWYNQWSKSKNK
jgi:two-component system, LytTR family, response regulator